MEGQQDLTGLPEDSARATTRNDTITDWDRNTTTPSIDVPSSPPVASASKPSIVTASPVNEVQKTDVEGNDLDMNSNDPPTQAQGSPAGEKKPSVAPHEAIRRGLSFGPIKKPGSRQNSITGILKTKSKSPSLRIADRSLSSTSDTPLSSGVGRLKKDYYENDADGEGAIESSDEDPAESSGDETSISERARGRKREGEVGQRTTPKSPLAGPADKPAVTVTGPEGETPRQPSSKRFVVHPSTNYDQNVSRGPSPSTSDSEELNDIRRAQRLNISSSAIDSSVPHRVIQTIIRGDFGEMQQEAKEGIRRLRTYLVATDLSGEAAYALEWTIGTVLRDGDTLLAVYAVDEEVGTGVTGDCLPIGEGAKAMQDTTAVMERMTIASQKMGLMSLASPLTKASFLPGSRKSSAANSTDSRALTKAEQERSHAIEKLSETCLRFLRKTKLQVRIAIEVIHCKSPKYMVTEAIDGLKPTMVIIGSRGRSALKGVLLGSFSNYLVTKSSAPVMVARKKLSGRKTKIASPNVRLANNLTPSRRLAEAKID